MAVEFTEYRGKRKRSFHKRKFPLLRLLFLVTLIVLAQVFGLFRKFVNALPLAVNKVAEVEMTWESMCDSSGGTFQRMENSLCRCSWNLTDSLDRLPTPLLRYVASMRIAEMSKIHWVADSTDFTSGLLICLEGDNDSRSYLQVNKNDSLRYWIDESNGCRFPGLCPQMPLGWAAVAIAGNFDFEGQESLLAKDVFHGIGEAPVYPVLPGVVLDVGRDSLGYFVEIDHGDNVTTLTSGMGLLDSPIEAGDTVEMDVPIGRLVPHDSAAFFLTVRRNGLFTRWNEFYDYSHPVDSASIAIFKKKHRF